VLFGCGLSAGANGRCMWRAEQEVSMTAEEFAEAVDKLIAAAREGGLSDAEMIVVLEDTVEGLDEGLTAA
jgi:hypothetical protein